jgi:choice-of-anchor C domain-containing protein
MKRFGQCNPVVSIIVASALLAAVSARATLLINGSFEFAPGGGLSVDQLMPGNTDILGWTVTRGAIDLYGTDGGWNAADGIHALDLNGSPGVGGIQQSFATTSGQVYSVNFQMAGNPSVGALMTMAVQAAGQSNTFSFSTIGHSSPNIGWTAKNWTFTAKSAQTTLEFYSTFTQSQFEGPALDNVSVDVVPEPGTLVMVAGGLLALMTIRSRR